MPSHVNHHTEGGSRHLFLISPAQKRTMATRQLQEHLPSAQQHTVLGSEPGPRESLRYANVPKTHSYNIDPSQQSHRPRGSHPDSQAITPYETHLHLFVHQYVRHTVPNTPSLRAATGRHTHTLGLRHFGHCHEHTSLGTQNLVPTFGMDTGQVFSLHRHTYKGGTLAWHKQPSILIFECIAQCGRGRCSGFRLQEGRPGVPLSLSSPPQHQECTWLRSTLPPKVRPARTLCS